MIHQSKDYPDIVSYNQFVEIMKFVLVPLILYTIKARFVKCLYLISCLTNQKK